MLVMMWAGRGIRDNAVAEAAASRHLCGACSRLVVGLGAADIDASVDGGGGGGSRSVVVCEWGGGVTLSCSGLLA